MTFVPFSEASARSATNEQTLRSITKEKKKKIKIIKQTYQRITFTSQEIEERGTSN